MNEFSRYWNTLSFIFKRYGEQKRKSANIPYVIHPIRVALILRSVGFSEFEDENLMIAALCHDILEDTDTTFEELVNLIGERGAFIVEELSKPNNKNKDEWLRTFKTKSNEAKIIKMADRIDNLLDMPSSMWTPDKQLKYAKQGYIILNSCGDVNYKLKTLLKKTIEEVLLKNES